MLRLLACFATFFFTSSKAAAEHWPGAAAGLLVDGSESSDDRVPMLDRAAVTVASGENKSGSARRRAL